MMKVLLTIASLCLWLCPTVKAQQWEPYVELYNKSSGLLSETSNYHLLQNREGVIWMASGGGVVRFDSRKFDHYWTIEEGLAERAQIMGYEDFRGVLWFVGMGGQITCYHNGRFFPFKYSSVLSKRLAWGKTTSFHVDSFGVFHIGEYGIGYLQMDSSGVVSEECVYPNAEGGVYYTEIEGKPFVFYVKGDSSTRIPVFHYSGREVRRVAYLYREGEISSGRGHTNLRITKKASGDLLIAKDSRVVEVKKDTVVVHSFDRPYVSITEDHFGGLWLSSLEKNGVHYWPDGDLSTDNKKVFLPNAQVHWILEDQTNGMWFGGEKKGVYRMAHPKWKCLRKPGVLSDLQRYKPNLATDVFFESLDSGAVYVYNGSDCFRYKIPDYDDEINVLHRDSLNGRIFLGGNAALFEVGPLGIRRLISDSVRIVGRIRSSTTISGPSDFLFNAGTLLYRFNNEEITLVSSKCPFEIQYIKLFNGVIYAATINGLWKYEDNQWIDLRSLSSAVNGRVMHLAIYDNELWVFGYQAGAIRMNKEGVVTPILIGDRPLKGVIGSRLVGDSLFLSSRQGNIYIVTRQDDQAYGIESKSTPAFFMREYSFQIECKGSRVFLGGQSHLYQFDLKDYRSSPAIYVNIDKIAIKGFLRNKKDYYSLPFDSNSISIDFSAIDFQGMGSSNYEYRMTNVNDWTSTKEQSVQFTILPPDVYQFDIRAQSVFGEVSETKTIHFNILPPYYETWWFRTSIGVLIVLLGWLVFRWQIGQVKKRSRLLNELQHSQHQALAARMNPHFIFNALNSIQQFTLKNDQKSAAAYMRDYAHLMRLVLENSSENLVSLESELEAIRIYLDLERLRSSEKISYRVELSENLDTSRFVLPALLLQPYLENAVWHGLMPKEPPGGNILIRLDGKNGRLQVEIEDNGIGRVKASELKTGNHPGFASQGTGINERRIQLIKSLYRINISVKTIDITGRHEPGIRGTKVIIVIPQPD